MTATANDEKIADLIARYGHAGYGAWWLVVEAVAAKLEGGGKPEVTYPLTKWSHLLSVRGSHVRHCLLKLEVTHLVTVEWSGSDITVRIPNLLKYRDEWSRKSGATPEKLLSKEQIQKENRTDKEEQPPTPFAPVGAGVDVPALEIVPAIKAHLNGNGNKPVKAGTRTSEQIRKALKTRTPEDRTMWWESFWKVYPCKDGMKAGMEVFERVVIDHEHAAELYRGAKKYAEKAVADPTMKLKYAQGWINDERWNDADKIQPQKQMTLLEQAKQLREQGRM